MTPATDRKVLAIEIPKSAKTSAEQFRNEFSRAASPVVLRGFVDDWPACQWGLPSIIEHWPNRAVRGHGPSGDGVTVREVRLTPDDLTRRFAAESNGAMDPRADWLVDIHGDLPEWLPEVPPPSVYGRRLAFYLAYFGRDTKTPSHYHPLQHAMICQVYGTKRVVLHPPEDSPLLYPHPIRTSSYFHVSRADSSAPDYRRFPRVQAASRVEVILEPGDALFIPIHWWHAVFGIGRVVSVSLFWTAHLREHRFPHPGFRNIVGLLRWNTRLVLEKVAESGIGVVRSLTRPGENERY